MSDINEKAIAVLEKEFTPALAAAGKIAIKSPEDMEKASTLLTQLNKYNDGLEKEKKSATDPLNASLKTIRGWFKPRQEKVEAAIENLRTGMGAYQLAAEKKAEKEKEKLAGRVEKGTMKAETAVKKMGEIDEPAANIEVSGGSVKFRTDKKLKITNLKAALEHIAVQKKWELVELNESALLAFLKEGGAVAGAEIEEVRTVINSR